MPQRRDYEFRQQLGRGSFGVVHKVQRKEDGATLVCKCISLKGMKGKALEEASQEVTLLRQISAGSPYIVDYVESFVEKDVLHIVMEFCEHGDLSNYLREQRGKPLEEPTVWKFLIQVGLGLQWLHQNRILHRDIKGLNVFLTAEDDARLGDLGVARVLRDGANFASTLIGTPYYLSPEMCEQKPYNDRSDVWAYGCVVYEMCTQKHPFDAQNQVALLAKIIRGRYAPVGEMYSSELRSIVEDCLIQDCARRPAISEVLARPAVASWAERLEIPGFLTGVARVDGGPSSPEARKRWKRASAMVSRMHEDAVKDLDAPARLVWDSLYRLLRAKMAADEELSEEDHLELERHVFEDLPPEHTNGMISKICKILPLQQECDKMQAAVAG
mmetsp:Transcript_125131/g.348204  ORF Transcript_125131/g.348204 Transcript_125131/m.348204 type:complete len:386 (-) Transcript_125131:195-1352(-)